MPNKIYLLLIIILISVAIGESDDDSTPPFFDPYGANSNSLTQNQQGSSVGDSSSTQMILPAETAPLNITRKIVYPMREGGFFNETKEKIAVLVEVTCLKKEGLENLAMWEIPGDGLKIENCSYPMRTSGIGQMLDYETSDKSFIKYDDINQTTIAKKLKHSSDPLYSRIWTMLNNSTQTLLNNSTTNDEILKEALFKDFSAIINNPDDEKFNRTYFRGSNATFRNETLIGDYYQGFNPKSENYLNLNDYRLFKRRLLEDAFWDPLYPGIRKISYYKEHEDLKITGTPQKIFIGRSEIGDAPLQEGESIIFKYYLHPEKLGGTEIRSIMRANNGFWHEETTPLNIIERAPQFKIDCWIGSKELTTNNPTKFEYFINYLGGDNPTKLFNISVIAPPLCELIDNKNKTDRLHIEKLLSKGKPDNFTVIASYKESGLTYSPPAISIEKMLPRVFPEDIQVFTEGQKIAKNAYEEFSIIILFIALIISTVTLPVIYYIDTKNKDRINRILENQNKILEAHKEAMIALKDAIEDS